MNALSRTKIGVAIAAALLAASCADSPPDRPGRAASNACFYARNVSSWAPMDRSVVNLRVNVSDYYQLTLLGDCPNIDWRMDVGLEHMGGDWICSGLDAMLIVRQPGGGVPPLRCPVRSIRKLSPAEVQALQPNQRP